MRRLFEAEPFLGYLGLEVVEARAGTAVAHASIDYRSLARGTLTARAELPAEDCERIRAELSERGRVRFPVAVALTDADGTIATTLTVEVAVRSRA